MDKPNDELLDRAVKQTEDMEEMLDTLRARRDRYSECISQIERRLGATLNGPPVAPTASSEYNPSRRS